MIEATWKNKTAPFLFVPGSYDENILQGVTPT